MVEEEKTEAGWGSRKELTMASSSFTGGKPLPVIEASSNCVAYPPPQAKYEDIVADPKTFMMSLEKLHSFMGTKFMIPIIGGKELDLHRLFVEVTSRGGIEKVIRERRWKEVTSVFNFPSTATNASFVLRKYYISLLHHFEQLYFFKALGWTPMISDSPQCPRQGTTSMWPPSDNQATVSQQPRVTATELPAVAPSSASAAGFPVMGVIDGKFESGYLVTVTVGSEKLKGVLYQAPLEQTAQQVSQPCVFAKDGATSTAPNAQRRRRRKKSEIKRRDPAHPKPNRSGYNFFFAEQHARLKPLYPGKDREISRMIGELWNKLKETERTVYQEKAMKDKERYRIEMEDYREKLRMGQIISDAVPLQQCHPEPDLNMVYADKNEETTEGGESPQTPDHDTSYVEGDSGDYKTEEKEDSEEDASPQGVGNVDVNILVEEEECGTRTAVEECGTRTAVEECGTRTVAEECGTRTAAEECGTRTAAEECGTRTVAEECGTRTAAEECGTITAVEEEDVRKESDMVGDDKEVCTGGDSVMVDTKEERDSVMVDAKEEEEVPTAIRED